MSAQPEDACIEIKPPPVDPFHVLKGNGSKYNWFVLINNEFCVMDKKVKSISVCVLNTAKHVIHVCV